MQIPVATAPSRTVNNFGMSIRFFSAPTPKPPVKAEIDAMIAEHKVFMVSKGFCPHCTRTKEALDSLGVQYHVLELEDADHNPLYEDSADVQDYMKEKTGARSVPRVFVGGKFVGGADDTVAKKNSGELTKLIKEAGAEVSEKTTEAPKQAAYEPDAATLAAAAAEAKLAKVKVGDLIPEDIALDKGFPPTKVVLSQFCQGKKVVLVGLPGAFTPT
jgi:glutaredoxin 3